MKTIDVPADGEETTSVKFVRYQYTVKKKQHVGIPWKNIQHRLKSFSDGSNTTL